jgi:hypothetical protein
MTHYPIVMQQGNNIAYIVFSWTYIHTYRHTHIRFYIYKIVLVCTSKRTPHFTITKINKLMLLKEIITFDSEILTTPRQNTALEINISGRIITTRL